MEMRTSSKTELKQMEKPHGPLGSAAGAGILLNYFLGIDVAQLVLRPNLTALLLWMIVLRKILW